MKYAIGSQVEFRDGDELVKGRVWSPAHKPTSWWVIPNGQTRPILTAIRVGKFGRVLRRIED